MNSLAGGAFSGGRYVVTELRRRLFAYVASLLVLTAVYTAVYQWGMATLEGDSRPWFHALEVVVQSMTTAGYGQDAPWETAEMTLLMILIQLTGIAYIFVAFPLFVVPWLRDLVQPSPPEELETPGDHVIILGYSSLSETLVDELEANDTAYVIVEPDEDAAQSLHEDGLTVLYGDPQADETLDAMGLETAKALVIDATDEDFIGAILVAKDRAPSLQTIALIADPSRSHYLRYAGADQVLSPRHRLGKALSDKVREVVTLDLDGLDDFRIVEYPVRRDSPLFDDALQSTRRLEATGATVMGAWVRGDLVTTFPADLPVDETTTLLVAGTRSDHEAVASQVGTEGFRYQPNREPVIVAGTGIVGTTAIGNLERSDTKPIVIDRRDDEIVDVVGDATDEETLTEAGIEEAATIIVALDDDEAAILTTLVARELAPEIEILVGANQQATASRLRTAGANYVLALPSVAGRMATLDLFEREAMTLGDRIRLEQVDADALATSPLGTDAVRSETGCAILGRCRDGRVETGDDSFNLVDDDSLVVAGTDDELERFHAQYFD